jgi:superoxide dismutase, Cu-Zn family
MLRTLKPLAAAAALTLAGLGCSSGHHSDAAGGGQSSRVIRAADMGADVKEAVAVIFGTQGNEKVKGTVKFSDAGGNGVKVTAHVEGLTPNQEHGFHVHEFGDATAPDGASAGGHFNPDKHEHGKPGDEKSHPGDMGNLKADNKGVAHLELTLPKASITGKNAILGRGVIVHAKPDDFSQPTGNAGGRIGIGIIGVAQVKK